MRGFSSWRIILAIIITAGVLLLVFGNQPSVQAFFAALREKISLLLSFL